jgi:hypothetical protein
MAISRIGVAAASIAAAGAVIAGGAAIATASDTTTPTAASTSSGAAANNGTTGSGSANNGTTGAPGQGRGMGMGGQHTAVTGAEADKVIAAVKAKDSAATITTVEKDPDGSYDATGTKDGSPVRYDVSADLKTVTEGGMGGHGGMGGMGGSSDAAVTGSEADKVIAAVKAKDSAATITAVRKDPDGSYDALGTKNGAPIMFDVSADLKTIAEAAGRGPGGHGDHGMGGPGMDGQSLPGTANSSTTSTAPTN